VWLTRRWRRCDKRCGGGTQYRSVNCVRAKDNALISHSYCRPESKPEHLRACNTKKCFVWKAHEWSRCSTSCGHGVRIRLTTCMDGDTGAVTDDEKCTEALRPNDSEMCNDQSCEVFNWKIVNESPCTKSCGGGFIMVVAYCVRNNNATDIQPNAYCTGSQPLRVKPCNTQSCPEYVWQKGEQSPCSATCGEGSKERSVTCVDQATGIEANERNCKATKPDQILSCNERQCVQYKVAYSAWQDCDVMCGMGVQKKNPYCITEDYKTVVNAQLCGEQAKVKKERVCQKSTCASASKFLIV